MDGWMDGSCFGRTLNLFLSTCLTKSSNNARPIRKEGKKTGALADLNQGGEPTSTSSFLFFLSQISVF